MATLQRSPFSFRRQGSPGVVWDDKFMNGEFRQRDEEGDRDAEYRELRPCQSSRPIGLKELNSTHCLSSELLYCTRETGFF